MPLIGSIGVGLFVLIILWIIALIVFVIGVKYQSNNLAWISLGSVSVVTAILVLIPLEAHDNESQDIFDTEKDYGFVWSALLLTALLLTTVIGFLLFFILHCIEPIRPKLIKSFVDTR